MLNRKYLTLILMAVFCATLCLCLVACQKPSDSDDHTEASNTAPFENPTEEDTNMKNEVTTAPEETMTEEKGCGASLLGASTAVAAALGYTLLKKRKDD